MTRNMSMMVFAACVIICVMETSVCVGQPQRQLKGASFTVAPPRASIRGIGDLPGGAVHSDAIGISPDGSLVLGVGTLSESEQPCYFRGHTLSGCGALPSGGSHIYKGAVTSIGGTPKVVGSYQVDTGEEIAFAWTPATGYRLLPVPGMAFIAQATAMNSEGSMVVGWSWDGTSDFGVALKWVGDVPQVLEAPPGYAFALPNGLSGDGRVIVGGGFHLATGRRSPVMWQSDTGTSTALEGFVGPYPNGEASAANADGTVVAGKLFDYSANPQTSSAFLWTPAGGFVTIPNPPGYRRVEPLGLSSDSRRMVGFMQATGGSGTLEAMICTPESGVMHLKDYLQSRGANVAGWRLDVATGISRDGRYVCGSGFHEASRIQEGWVADLGID